MGIEYGLFCDDCEVYIEIGEWLFTTNSFQRNDLVYNFLFYHSGHRISLHDDTEQTFLDKIYDGKYKEEESNG